MSHLNIYPAVELPSPTLKRAFKEFEAATYLGVSRSYLRQDRMNGARENRVPGPEWIKFGRSIRYLKEDLDSWLESFRNADSQAA